MTPLELALGAQAGIAREQLGHHAGEVRRQPGDALEQLGDAGSKVSLELEFEFENRATDILFGRFFEKTCNSLVDSFTRRAAQLYAGIPMS